MRALAALLTVPMLLVGGSAAAAEREEIEKAAAHFLTSFENLDMPVFIERFAEDATVFFPPPEPPERVAGKAAIRERFQLVFDAIRKNASGGPPYHRLAPQNLEVQVLSAETAVVSFHLRNSERIARRTLVMRKVQGAWLVAHLHASNFQIPKR